MNSSFAWRSYLLILHLAVVALVWYILSDHPGPLASGAHPKIPANVPRSSEEAAEMKIALGEPKASPNSAQPSGASEIAEIRLRLADQQEQELRDQKQAMLRRKASERIVQTNYSYILGALTGLGNDTLAKLKDLLVARDVMATDVYRQAMINGIPTSGPQYEAFKTRLLEPENQRIADLLGDHADQFFAWDKIVPSIATYESGMRLSFEYAGVPLDQPTVLKLAQAMYALNYGMNIPEYRALIKEPVDPETGLIPLFSRLIGQSAGFLSPQQIKVLKDYQDEVRAALKL